MCCFGLQALRVCSSGIAKPLLRACRRSRRHPSSPRRPVPPPTSTRGAQADGQGQSQEEQAYKTEQGHQKTFQPYRPKARKAHACNKEASCKSKWRGRSSHKRHLRSTRGTPHARRRNWGAKQLSRLKTKRCKLKTKMGHLNAPKRPPENSRRLPGNLNNKKERVT